MTDNEKRPFPLCNEDLGEDDEENLVVSLKGPKAVETCNQWARERKLDIDFRVNCLELSALDSRFTVLQEQMIKHYQYTSQVGSKLHAKCRRLRINTRRPRATRFVSGAPLFC